jgi:hypothetical protein
MGGSFKKDVKAAAVRFHQIDFILIVGERMDLPIFVTRAVMNDISSVFIS